MRPLYTLEGDCVYNSQRYNITATVKSHSTPKLVDFKISTVPSTGSPSMSSINYERTNLFCPLSEKNECKDTGALWDPAVKTWYVLIDPDTGASSKTGQPLTAFKRWLKPSTVTKISALKKKPSQHSRDESDDDDDESLDDSVNHENVHTTARMRHTAIMPDNDSDSSTSSSDHSAKHSPKKRLSASRSSSKYFKDARKITHALDSDSAMDDTPRKKKSKRSIHVIDEESSTATEEEPLHKKPKRNQKKRLASIGSTDDVTDEV